VPYVTTERLEVRLDAEHRRRLQVVAGERGARVSDVVRQLIDRAYEESERENRLRAAAAIRQLAVEDVPEPATLREQIVATYDVTGLN
jgi:hypothetical protein